MTFLPRPLFFIVPSALAAVALLSSPHERALLIVDAGVPDASFFVDHARPGTEVVFLDPSADAVTQLTDILSSAQGIQDVQIVSHGAPGSPFLAGQEVDADVLRSRAADIVSWSGFLEDSAEISFLGCDVGAGPDGRAFVDTLASLTGLDVSASSDATGADGDWDLEVTTGRLPGLLAFFNEDSYAHTLNHFRYGTMSFTQVTGRTVLIKIENDWTNTHGFIPTNTPIGGVVADKFVVDFGDGTTENVDLRVTARDAANNDVQTEAVTLSGATYITGLRHTYASDGNYKVAWESGSRESANSQANSNWRSEMRVNIGGGNSSPVVAVPAVVQVQDNTIFEYALTAVDPNGNTLRYRLGTQGEFYSTGTSTPTTPPTGLTLSSTGAIRWDVRNVTLSTAAGARWQMTAMVEDLSSTGAVKSYVPIDFVFVITNNAPPRFVSYPTGTQAAPVGETKSVSLVGTDPNWQTGYTSPSISALNPPSTDHAVWTGSLIRASSGATYNVNFTPTEDMRGQTFVVIFRLTNSSGATAVQPVSFLVPGANQAPSDITLSPTSIVEHSPTGSDIGTLTASDIDPGDAHTFTLTGATNTSIFTIGGGAGNKLRIADSALASSGTYTVSVRATDSGSLFLDKSFTVKLWLDEDEDLIADYEDSLIGDKDYVSTQGVGQLSVRVGGTTASGTYTGSQSTIFSDGDTDLFSFVPDYDNATIHLANILVKKTDNSLVVNTGNELPAGVKKTLYLTDNNFISVCVKDAVISSEVEITSACTGTDEIDFTSCIGNGAGVTINSITCTDEGPRFRFENLSHSGVIGTPPASSSSTVDSTARTETGGSGGGGGGRRSIPTYFRAEADHAAAGEQPSCDVNNLFKDVRATDWFALPVCVLKTAGVISGYKDASGAETGRYGPGNDVNYAELAKMALLASGNLPNDNGPPVNRTARGDWSAPYIRAMEGLKIPVYAASLDVHSPATRADVISVLLALFEVRIDEHAETGFSDLPLSHDAADAVLTAVDIGIVQGDTDASGALRYTIRPDDRVNRAETAKIFHLMLRYAVSH